MLPIPPFANIDLTDDQVGQLAKLKRTFDSVNAGAFATLHTLEDDMRDKLTSENINESPEQRKKIRLAQDRIELGFMGGFGSPPHQPMPHGRLEPGK